MVVHILRNENSFYSSYLTYHTIHSPIQVFLEQFSIEYYPLSLTVWTPFDYWIKNYFFMKIHVKIRVFHINT